jgi:L,D-peptidoglycan transpeptidase YkuD (ErfK/YbiS/YcfS/YnhG family)
MMFSVYAADPGMTGRLRLQSREVWCALGRGGVRSAADKREGDGATPAGLWPLRKVLWRPDKLAAPAGGLPAQAIEPHDGWCDAPADPAYNCPVRLPYPASAEPMWRKDDLYDLVVVLGHNDSPVVPGAGSAIFMHVALPDYAPTEGCIALALADLVELVRGAKPGDALRVAFSARAGTGDPRSETDRRR